VHQPPFGNADAEYDKNMEFDLLTFLVGLLNVGLSSTLWILVLAFGFVRWPTVRPLLKTGLMLGAVVLALKLPGLVASFIYFDVAALLPADLPEDQRLVFGIAAKFGLSIAPVWAAFGVFHMALQFALGEQAPGSRSAYPVLLNSSDPRRFEGWMTGAVLGLVAGVASTLLFSLLDVQLGDTMKMIQKLMPGFQSAPPLMIYGVAGTGLVVAAIAEEVLFRGVLQAWTIRLLGGGWAGVLGGIAVASVVWSLAHVGNAEPIWIKLTQVLILGIGFGALAYRYSVEAAIVAHIGLNVTVLITSAFLSVS
jgi:membrane protease YdiL (CAAX protease family)